MIEEKLRKKMEEAYQAGNEEETLYLSRLLDKQIVRDMRQKKKSNKSISKHKLKTQKRKSTNKLEDADVSDYSIRFFKVFMFIGFLFLFNIKNVNASGDLFGNAQNLLNDVYAKFIGFSTAAAGIGVGTGVFMRKFSLGKQHQIELGGKIIKDSLIGWGVINGLGLILNYISNYTV